MPDTSYAIAVSLTRFNPNSKSDVNDLIQALKAVKDWPQLINVIMAQGVFLLFCQAIDSTDVRSAVSDHALKSIAKMRHHLAAINIVQEAALEKLLSILNNQNIPVLLPKGLLLDRVLYSEPNLRFSNDIDIFVHDSDFNKAYSLLVGQGFERIPNKHGIAFAYCLSSLKVMIELGTLRRQKKARFRETYVWDPDEIWKSAEKQELCNGLIMKMRPEHQLIFLALHLSERHQFERLLWFRDIAEVIRHYSGELDWGSVVDYAKAWDAGSYVYFSLLFSNQLAGANVPDNVLEELKPRYLSGKLFEKYASNNGAPVFPLSRRSLLFQLFSIIGDSGARRLWAEALLPYHVVCHFIGFDPNDLRPEHRLRSINAGIE